MKRNTRINMYNEIVFEKYSDERGSLIALEQFGNIPFEIKRIYYLYDQSGETRGFHAHKNLQQVLICLHGQCKLILDNGIDRVDVVLNSADTGIHIGNLIWREVHDQSEDCVLLVVASELYDESDYIKTYEEFLTQVQGKRYVHSRIG